ncbi:AHH domain-containing protein [Stratiformator vulcanicus]|uniref:AHH domain-containing protein n=1 Tax=Stratiformator vulcanicus TaxID=2527980 RepID=UPI0035C66255
MNSHFSRDRYTADPVHEDAAGPVSVTLSLADPTSSGVSYRLKANQTLGHRSDDRFALEDLIEIDAATGELRFLDRPYYSLTDELEIVVEAVIDGAVVSSTTVAIPVIENAADRTQVTDAVFSWELFWHNVGVLPKGGVAKQWYNSHNVELVRKAYLFSSGRLVEKDGNFVRRVDIKRGHDEFEAAIAFVRVVTDYAVLGFAAEANLPTDPGDVEEWIEYRQGLASTSAEITATGAELYISGIAIAGEPIDWALAVSDIVEGDLTAAVAFLPFVTAGGLVVVRRTGIGDEITEVVFQNGREAYEWFRNSRSLRSAMNAMPTGFVAHHVIPAASIQQSEFLLHAVNVKHVDLNAAWNGFALPGSAAARNSWLAAGNQGKFLPIHNSGHPQYRQYVENELEKIQLRWISDNKDWSLSVIRTELFRLRNDLIDRMKNGAFGDRLP